MHPLDDPHSWGYELVQEQANASGSGHTDAIEARQEILVPLEERQRVGGETGGDNAQTPTPFKLHLVGHLARHEKLDTGPALLRDLIVVHKNLQYPEVSAGDDQVDKEARPADRRLNGLLVLCDTSGNGSASPRVEDRARRLSISLYRLAGLLKRTSGRHGQGAGAAFGTGARCIQLHGGQGWNPFASLGRGDGRRSRGGRHQALADDDSCMYRHVGECKGLEGFRGRSAGAKLGVFGPLTA